MSGREIMPEERVVMERIRGTASLDRWAALWENLRTLFQRAAAVNLDRKQVILDAFLAVEATAAS
jgi:DNA polymerase-3 subunit delta'